MKGGQAFKQTKTSPQSVLFPSLKPRAALSCWAILLPSPGAPLLLPCPAGWGGTPHRHSLKVIVDVHPAILGDADEEGIESDLHVLEMHGHKRTKESNPKHGKHLPERPKTMPELYPRTLETGHANAMQMNTAKGIPGILAQRFLLFSRQLPIPNDPGALVRKGEQVGVRGGH